MAAASRAPSLGSAEAKARDLAEAHPELDIRVRKPILPRHHVYVWLVATFLAGLLPLVATALHEIDGHRHPGFHDLLEKGDLLLVSLVASIAAFGDLALKVRRTKARNDLSIWLLLVAEVLLIALAGIWYGDLSSQVLGGTSGDPNGTVVLGSLVVYGLTGLFGSMCIWNAAGAE